MLTAKMESRPRREIKLPAKFKEEEGAAVGKKNASKEAEEDEPVVYCICRKPYKEGDFMIHCDKCKEWFHGNCVKVTQREAAKIKKYVCPMCQKEETPAVVPLVLEEPSKIPKKHRSLETAKVDKTQPATLVKAAEAKPPKAPAGAKSSGAGSKASKAAEAAKETVAAKPHEKTGNGAEPTEKEKNAKRKAPEGAAKGAEKAKEEDKEEGKERKEGKEGKDGREGKGREEGTEGMEQKEGAAPLKTRPKKEDLVCSACKNKGHIRTHRECPLFGLLPSPSNGKKAGPAVAADQKPTGGGASKTEKHKEVVVPSDEDEPILARKKPAPSPKVPSTSALPPASVPAVEAAPHAGDDDDHAHMLHPVNTSSHFDTGATLLVAPDKPPATLEAGKTAALLVAPDKPPATLEAGKSAPAETKGSAPSAKPQAALSGEKRKMDVGLEGADRAASDAKKARPQIPPLEAASEHSRQGVAEPRRVNTPESAPSGPVSETPRTPKPSPRQPDPEGPRRAHEGARGAGAVVHGPPKMERSKSETKEHAGGSPSLSRQESSKGAKRGREEMEGKAGGVKKQGLDQAHADYKARMAFKNSLAGALATDAKEGGAGTQPPTPKRGADGAQAGTPKPGDAAAPEGRRESGSTAGLAETSGGAREGRVEGATVGEGSGVAGKKEDASGDVAGSDGGSGLAVLAAGGEVSALGIPEAGAIEKGPGSKPPGGENQGEEQKPGSATGAKVGGSPGTREAAGLPSGGAAALSGPSGEHTPGDANTESGGQIEGSTAASGHHTDKSGAAALDEASLLRLAEEVAGEIEAALYAHFGGTGNPYRQQTRMLVFNLKTNPELRARVLGKEVAPKQLCTATADELARKELSDWRHAKEEALSALKVLTEDPLEALRRVRKKTHKGEEDVEIDKDRMAAAIMEGDKKAHEGGEEEEAGGASAKMEEPGAEEVAEEPLKRQRSAEGHSMTSVGVTGPKTGETSDDGKAKASVEPALSGTGGAVKKGHVSAAGAGAALEKGQSAAPEGGAAGRETGEGGLSLEEYLEACMTAGGGSDQGSEDGGDEKMGEWVASDDEEEKVEATAKQESAAAETKDDDKGMDDLLWEGNLMLSGRPCPTIASFVGGERMPIETWPMAVEVKGRVKMADFRAFMTSPQLHKHRVVMVVGLKYLGDAHADSKNHLAIASQNYLEANRVGYAEPVPSLEVYIAPPKAEGLGAFLPLEGDWGEAGELLAVVVRRRFPPEGPPGSEPPAQQQQRQSGGPAPQGTQPRAQSTAQAGGEDVWSPPTSPFDLPGGQKGPQAWPSKKAEQGGPSGPTEAPSMEPDQASMQRKRRDPRLRVFQPSASSPSPTPPQEEPAGPPGFPIPRPPATLPPPPAASPPVPQTFPTPPPVRSPDQPRSHAPPVPPNFFPGGSHPPHTGGPGPSLPPFRGAAPARAPSPPAPGLRHQDDDLPDVELPHLGPYQQARPPPRPPGILPPLPPGPPPLYVQPPFPYMGHTPPRGPLPPLPPGPPPPHFQQQEGRPGSAPYLPPPPPFQGPSPTLGGAPQRGPEHNGRRRRRGGRNRKQGPVLGEQMGDERVMAQWLQEEGGSDSDGHDEILGEWQPPGKEQ